MNDVNDQRRGNAATNDMLTYKEAAWLLGVPVGTVYAWVHTRGIPHVRLGARLVRFRRSDLLEWLGERTIRAAAVPTPRLRTIPGHAS